MAKAKLVYQATGQLPVELPLEEPVITIGRLEDNAIQLHNEGVSRHHARLELQGDDYVLSDLHSTNGTQVNGLSITGPVVLHDGDVLVIGGATLSYRCQAPSAAPGASYRPQPQPKDAPPQARRAPAARPASVSDKPATAKKSGKGFPLVAIVGGAVAILCLVLACGAAAAYVVISQGTEDATPTAVASSNPTPDQSLIVVVETPPVISSPLPPKTPAGVSSPTTTVSVVQQASPTTKANNTPAPANTRPPNATVLTKAQDYNSTAGKYTVRLPAGAAFWEAQNRLNVSYQGSSLSFSVEHFADLADARDARDKVITGLKQRQGVTFAADRPAFVNDASGVRTAAEYPERNGQTLSHTIFVLEHDNGLFYLIQAIDNAADLEKDQVIFQGLIGSLAFH